MRFTASDYGREPSASCPALCRASMQINAASLGVMPALVAGIHAATVARISQALRNVPAWMAGSSPAMTGAGLLALMNPSPHPSRRALRALLRMRGPWIAHTSCSAISCCAARLAALLQAVLILRSACKARLEGRRRRSVASTPHSPPSAMSSRWMISSGPLKPSSASMSFVERPTIFAASDAS